MRTPVEINVEEIKRLIHDNRRVYGTIDRHISRLMNLILDLRRLAVEATTTLLPADLCVGWGAQIRSYEADVRALRLQQAQQDEIHAVLQQLVDAVENGLVIPHLVSRKRQGLERVRSRLEQ
jgi:hypothetical protein